MWYNAIHYMAPYAIMQYTTWPHIVGPCVVALLHVHAGPCVVALLHVHVGPCVVALLLRFTITPSTHLT